jgi:hypothetical protein
LGAGLVFWISSKISHRGIKINLIERIGSCLSFAAPSKNIGANRLRPPFSITTVSSLWLLTGLAVAFPSRLLVIIALLAIAHAGLFSCAPPQAIAWVPDWSFGLAARLLTRRLELI